MPDRKRTRLQRKRADEDPPPGQEERSENRFDKWGQWLRGQEKLRTSGTYAERV